ncbi:hypothetical protein ACFL6C_00460 [Myxococcota bacterium]
MRSQTLFSCVSVILIAHWSTPAVAVEGEVTIRPAAGSDVLANALGLAMADLEALMEAELEKAFNLLEPGEYVRALADAQAFSNKGLGVDYASNPTLFVAGLAGNFAMALGDEGLGEYYSERPVVGASPNISIMAGLNLDMFGFDWLTLYGNFFTQASKVDEISGNLLNYGFHAQVKFFRPDGDATDLLFQWGGLDITTGYEYSRLKMELEKELDTPFPLEGSSGVSTDAMYGGTGTYQITTTASTIPLELTTNLRLLYVATLFLGVGYDLQFGSGKMEVDLDGTLTADNPIDGSEVELGTAQVVVTQDAKPSQGQFRLLLGLQINISVLKLFVQLNLVPPDRAISGGGGVRVAW